MAEDDVFYTAWDGNRYAGQPPAGWFLAADNRWWPSTSMIEGEEQTPGEESGSPPAGSAHTDPSEQTAPSVPPGVPPSTTPSPPPTPPPGPQDSWAPETVESNGDNQRGQGSSGGMTTTGRGRSTRRRRGRRFPIWPVIVAVFLISRCNINSDQRSLPTEDPQQVTVLAEGYVPDFVW